MGEEVHLPDPTVGKKARSFRKSERRIAARDPRCPPQELRKLANEHPELHPELLSNPSTPTDAVVFILGQVHTGLRQSYARKEVLDDLVIRVLARDSSPQVRSIIASRIDVPGECVAELSKDSEASVLHRVAFNKSFPDDVRQLASERRARSEEVAERCYAAHPEALISHETRRLLIQDPEPGVRSHAAKRSDLTESELRTLIRDDHELVIQSAVSNPLIFSYGLLDLIDLTKNRHINGLLHNTACPQELRDRALSSLINGLGGDPDWFELVDATYLFTTVIESFPDADKQLVKFAANAERWRANARSIEEWRTCDDILYKLVRRHKLPAELHEHASRLWSQSVPGNLPDSVPGTFDSPPEEAFWLTVRASQSDILRELVPQFVVDGFRLDFALPEHRLGIEVDGLAYHSGQDAFQKDRERQRKLEMMGWRILRFTAREVQSNPQLCVQQADEWVRSCSSAQGSD